MFWRRAKRLKQIRKPVALALQGGGAHGAFTWGVLDRLLEDGRLEIEAISGTSAGAMNATVVADGFVRGGADTARERLQNFWKAVSSASQYSPIQRAPLDVLMGNWTLDRSVGYAVFDYVTKLASPYTLNPLNLNPLKRLIEGMVDFESIRRADRPLLFISCTNVETGQVKVFQRKEMDANVVMASACLPFVFQAVEIDGVPYWDGGYMGNPVMFPFHRRVATQDYVIVQINPVRRKGTPKTAREIMNRVNEISFNASLQHELRAINFVQRLIGQGVLSDRDYKRINLHIISADQDLLPLGASSKFNTEWSFLQHLFEIGRNTATSWLAQNFDQIGHKQTANLDFLIPQNGDEFLERYVGRLR